jgi:integrase
MPSDWQGAAWRCRVKQVRHSCRCAGDLLPPAVRLHDLRHDAATRFWKTHKDLALLKEFLGDRDTESVMRYVNIDGKEASRLMRKRRSV